MLGEFFNQIFKDKYEIDLFKIYSNKKIQFNEQLIDKDIYDTLLSEYH